MEPATLRGEVDTENGPEFEQFFDTEYGRLVRAMYLITGDPAEAEDLAQESMARALERWARVRIMASPGGYVYRTALNLNRKRLRHLSVRRRRTLHTPLGSDLAERAEQATEVRRILASLPDGQREAVVLVAWLGMTAEEAGVVLGIEAASVRSRMRHAREAFRANWEAGDG